MKPRGPTQPGLTCSHFRLTSGRHAPQLCVKRVNMQCRIVSIYANGIWHICDICPICVKRVGMAAPSDPFYAGRTARDGSTPAICEKIPAPPTWFVSSQTRQRDKPSSRNLLCATPAPPVRPTKYRLLVSSHWDRLCEINQVINTCFISSQTHQ